MESHGLSEKELESLFKFEGYGNKSAPYWFLGIEEGGGSIEQLRLRAKHFEPVEDIHAVVKIGLLDEMLKNSTLRVMSKLIMAMQRMSGWQERSPSVAYHATMLGRLDGDTFLTELMPLPCPNSKVWPYESICPTRKEYNAMVRPGRIRWLRSEIATFKPRFVICYGKGNWRYHKEIFSDVEFKPELNEKIQVGKDGVSTILLIPFLSYDLVTTALITQIAGLFGRPEAG